jgi:hypothetical protein
MSAVIPRAILILVCGVMIAACGGHGDTDGSADEAREDYAAEPTKACLAQRGFSVGYGDNQITITNSADKLVGHSLIAFVGPGLGIVFAKDAYAASEVEAAVENPQTPNDTATARGNAVFWWNGSEPPADEYVEQIVDCLR